MKKMFDRKRRYGTFLPFLLLFFLSYCLPVSGNNIRINAPVKVSAGTGDTLVLEFPLQWDNSWRDEFNWDAAWVFLKYKVGTGDWKHVPLSFGGHSFNGSSGQPVHFDYMPGQTGSNTLGLFVYRSKLEAGNTPEIICKLKCLKSALGGMTAEKFDTHEAFIRAQAIEMAYIPYGAYYLGDGNATGAFHEAFLAESNPLRKYGNNGLSASSVYANDSYSPSYGLQNAIDANINSHWHSLGTTEEWFMVDLGQSKRMEYFTIRTHYAGSNYYLEGSDDANGTWTQLWTGTGSDWSQTQNRYKITTPGSYRYYRFRLQGNYFVIYDVALWEQAYQPLLLDSEEAVYTDVTTGSLSSYVQLPATYPKGYKGFYTMKYELSQEQYVAFLNTLSYAQQQERVPGLASMKEGDYIFGDHSQPSNRNGICVAVASFNNQPVIFANNLTNDNKYAQDNDGKTVACNYLSPNDMLGYCSWSGLRPMSELEYEKACRPTYPDPVIAKSYAWNTTTVPGRLSSVNNGGQRNEVSGSNNTNVNAGNTFGPVRCGLFATSASNQQAAGATFWGVAEMSGNLRELCYNIGAATTFNGGVLGDGTYNLTKWNNTVGNFGVRGGGFTSNDDLLRVSDRTEATGYFTALEQHDSTVTFRGVRSIGDELNISPGEIKAGADTICPGEIGLIENISLAATGMPGLDFTYLWYVKKPGGSVFELVSGETKAELQYGGFVNSGTTGVRYDFKRKAICAVGEVFSGVISVIAGIMPMTTPSVPLSYNSVVGTQFDLPCITNGDLRSEWKSPGGDILDCASASVITKLSPEKYQVYYVNKYGCSGPLADVTISGYSLSSIPKHAKEYLAAGATRDGVYVLDPDGAGGKNPLPTYCNMTNDGGGWMLMVNSLSTTAVSTLYTAGEFNLPYFGNIYMPYKHSDSWINLIQYSAFWTEGVNACGNVSNSYWKASECTGGGIFSTLNACGESKATYACTKRYSDAAMQTVYHEGYGRCMFDDDKGRDAYFIWPYHCSAVYVEWGHACNNGGSGSGEYRIWVR